MFSKLTTEMRSTQTKFAHEEDDAFPNGFHEVD